MSNLAALPLLQIVVTALASAWLTSTFQNKDHRYRKHWELRVEAYRELIEGLAGIEQYWEAVERAAMRGSDLSEEAESRLDPMYRSGYASVRKAALTGVFLFSHKVEGSLHLYLSDRKLDPSDWFGYVEGELAAVSGCRRDVVDAARTDLEVLGSWRNRARRFIVGKVTRRRQITTDC
jgi:hypothetical protein